MTILTMTRERIERIQTTIFSIVMAFLIVGIMLALVGFNPAQVYAYLVGGSLGTASGLGYTTVQLIPLLLTGLASAIAFKGGLWNIGAEGQLYLGAIAATLVGITPITSSFHLPIAIIAGFLAGVAGGGLAGVLKAYFDIDEIVSTIMMNFIVIVIVQYLILGPINDPEAIGYAKSVNVLPSARYPFGTTLVLIFVLVVLGVFFIVMERTTFGFEARMLGSNPLAAAYAGVNVKKLTVLLMSISGGIAGLAGACIICGITGWLTDTISRSYGYIGIVIALLAGLNPLLVIPASLLFAVLFAGGTIVMAHLKMSSQIVAVISAVIILSFLVSGPLLARIKALLARIGGLLSRSKT